VAVLQKSFNVGNGYGLFEVNIADQNLDAEYRNFTFQISGSLSGLSEETVQAAVQAFADSLVASSPTFAQISIVRTDVTDTSL